MSRSRLRPARTRAFVFQKGRCCYCRSPMWLDAEHRAPFATHHGISFRQAGGFQATAEHLLAHQDGGRGGSNIAASCWLCNQRRHKRPVETVLDPIRYAAYVQERVARGKWFPFILPLSLQAEPVAPAPEPSVPAKPGVWERVQNWWRRHWPAAHAELVQPDTGTAYKRSRRRGVVASTERPSSPSAHLA